MFYNSKLSKVSGYWRWTDATVNIERLDKEWWQQFYISDMALFTWVQRLCTFNINVTLIYHLLPNVWKALCTISPPIFVDVPYWPSYSTDKFISCCTRSHTMVLAAPPSSSAQKKTMTLRGLEPHHSSWQCKEPNRLRRWQWKILVHPPYSPDMSPCDYDLFAKVKEPV